MFLFLPGSRWKYIIRYWFKIQASLPYFFSNYGFMPWRQACSFADCVCVSMYTYMSVCLYVQIPWCLEISDSSSYSSENMFSYLILIDRSNVIYYITFEINVHVYALRKATHEHNNPLGNFVKYIKLYT